MSIAGDAIEVAAARIVGAHTSRTPCAPVRDLLEGGTIDDAYAVQQAAARMLSTPGRRLGGRKIGLTSPAVQRQFGVDQPDFGLLFADLAFGDGQLLPTEVLLQPRVEAEVAFVLGRDLAEWPVTPADVLRATEFVVAAIEVVDSRIAGWDITILDTVADNASSGLYVLGASPRLLREIDLHDVCMTMSRDGEEVSTGTGAACLGHPVNAVVWLANAVAERGAPLRAGETVLSGALGKLADVRPGDVFEARIDGLGSVRAVFDGPA